VDAGAVLERSDVPALTADDPALHVVRGELDDRDRRLGRVARRDALEGVGDECPRLPLRLAPRLFLELAHAARELVAHEILRALEQVGLRLAGRHPRDPLERRELLLLRVLEVLLELLPVRLPVGDPLLAP